VQAHRKVRGNWKLLAKRVVDYTFDRDVISAHKTTPIYSTIKIKVREESLTVRKVTVVFKSGTNQEVNLLKDLDKGTDGKIIDLAGADRGIEKILF